MPAGGNQSIALPNVMFAQGYLYCTQPGQVDFSDNCLYGELENVSIDFKSTSEELMGPESYYALAVACSKRSISIKAEWASIRAQTLRNALGAAAPTTSGGKTFLRSGDSTDLGNPVLQLHLKTPGDGSDMEIAMFAAYSDSLGLAFPLKKFVKPSWTANAIRPPTAAATDPWGNPNTNRDTYVIALPGDQTPIDAPSTSNPVAPGTMAAAAGAVGSKQILVTWGAVAGATLYTVEISTAAIGPFVILGDTTLDGFVDTEAASGTTKYFRVRAQNAAGYGPYGAIVNAASG